MKFFKLFFLILILSALNNGISFAQNSNDCINCESQAEKDENKSAREKGLSYVEQCSKRNPTDSSFVVDKDWKAICKKNPAIFSGDHAYYKIQNTGEGKIKLQGKIFLKTVNANGKKLSRDKSDLLIQKTKSCQSQMNQYWNRYGIILDFEFSSESTQGKNASAGDIANTLTVVAGPGRSNSKTFYFDGLNSEVTLPNGQKIPGGPAITCLKKCEEASRSPLLLGLGVGKNACYDLCELPREREYCLMMLHEFGHRLSLEDEYADPLCPDRSFISSENNPYSVMAVPYVGFFDVPEIIPGIKFDSNSLDFYPRHLKKILGDFCR